MRRLAVAALATAILWLATGSPASARGHCSGDFVFDRRACEAGHHVPLVAVAGGLAGLIALVGSGLLDGGRTAAAQQRGGGGGSGTAVGATDEATTDGEDQAPPPIRPEDLGLPPVDAWGDPIYVHSGEYADGEPGQVWWNGEWIDAQTARERVREGFEAVAAQDARREEFLRESERISEEWMRGRTAAHEAEAAAERAANQRRVDAWAQLERVIRISSERDYDDIFERASNNAFRDDGTLNVEYVEALREATRNRIGRNIAAPDEDLEQGWVDEFVRQTAEDVSRSAVIRIGTGILSGGSSEVFYQSLAAARRIQEEVNQAVDRGEEYGALQAIRAGLQVLVEENLPVNTIRVLGDPEATWPEVATAGVLDLFATMNTVETGRNLRGSLNAARRRAGLGEVATHRAPGLFDSLVRRSDNGNRLWRDPMDVDWQTGGPRAGLDLGGLRRHGATIDGASAHGLAPLRGPELNPPGGIQTRLPEEWGMRRPDAIHIQQVASDELVRIDVRPSTPRAPQLLDQGVAVPKPPEIKVKTVNEIDIEHLGRPRHAESMAAHFDPPMPGSPPGTKPVNMSDDQWSAVWKRYVQRKEEFAANLQSVRTTEGWTPDADGVLRNARGQGATGDYDLFEIRNFDGSPVSPAVRERVVQRLMDGPANVQHGAHLDWPAQARLDFEAGLRSSPDLTPKEVAIYNRIIESHQTQEALIRFGPGQPRIDTMYTTAQPLPMPRVDGPGTG